LLFFKGSFLIAPNFMSHCGVRGCSLDTICWQLRIVIIMNRQAGLNLLVQAATEAIQQWARDVKQMRMGILIVIHTFGADMKWYPHIHLIVTGGGLSLEMYILWSYMVIPKRRILRFERFFNIKKSQPFVWECHDCHEGVIIPGTYKNIHGETVEIDPKTLNPNTEVICF